MGNKLKYVTLGLLVVCFVADIFLSVKFDSRDEYDMERDARREQIEEEFSEGISYAQDRIVNHLDTVLMDIDYEIEDIYGIHPEEALRIMENYLDNEPISDEELANAIWAIRAYYHKSQDIPSKIEDYWIE